MKKPWTKKRILLWVVGLGIAVWAITPYFYSRESDESLDDILDGSRLEVSPDITDRVEEISQVAPKVAQLPVVDTSVSDDEASVGTDPGDSAPPTPQPREEPVSEPGESTGEPAAQPLPPPAESETAQEASTATLLGVGSFVGLAGHNGEGVAKLIKVGERYFIRFEDDFRVTNGPDLFVDLGSDGDHDGSARLGRLKGSTGGQNYEVPADVDVEQYNEIWVWCRAFSVPFAKAVIK